MLSSSRLAEAARLVRVQPDSVVRGRVARVTGLLVEAHLPGARIGERVELVRADGVTGGEVVGFRDALAIIVPHADVHGLTVGAPVERAGGEPSIPAGEALIGRVVDAEGRPLDGGPPPQNCSPAPLRAPAPIASLRAPIAERFETGLRSIDGLLTLGRGQRVGIFAGAGVGKTVLLRQIVAQSRADITVFGLIGERGVEVHDVLLSGELRRSVVVAATSDRSPLERARGALAATAVAEYFRDRGAHVLLVIDSLTRYAMALREIGLAAGEPPATKGYPPSVFAALPQLLERVAPLGRGSITGVYTVLVEGDDLADPVADSARSLLDGHLVLSRDLAARGHFPALDVLASASRVLGKVTDARAQALIQRARALLATRREAEELRSLGAYVPGANPAYDQALQMGARLDGWLKQGGSERSDYETTLRTLAQLIEEKK